MNILNLINIEETQFKKVKSLPSSARNLFTFTKGFYNGANFVIARSINNLSLDEIRSNFRLLSNAVDLPICLHLNSCSSYSIKCMVKEGIPFYIEHRFAFIPFLQMLGKYSKDRPAVMRKKMSMVSQSLLLNLIYSNIRKISVTDASALVRVSKMSISKSFDELEALLLPISVEGRQRVFSWDLPWGLLLKNTLPLMSSPVRKEYRLAEALDLPSSRLSGISALSKMTLLGDNEYPTVAVLRQSTEAETLISKDQVPSFEKPGMICLTMNYFVNYKENRTIDPVSAWLSLPDNYPTDARVRFEVGRLFAKEFDGWDSSWPLI